MHAEMGCRYAAPLGGARTTIVFNGNVFKHQGLQRRHAHGQVPKQLTRNRLFSALQCDSEIRAPNIF